MIPIRAYVAADFAGVAELWRAVFPDDPPYSRAEVAIPAKLAVQPQYLLIATDGERVVGTASGGYDGTRGWLYAVAVAASHRRQGLGARLVQAVEARLAAAGCGKINLQVRAGNADVTGFYESLGYCVEPRVSMGKRLGVNAGGTGTSGP
ncbi:GNAT family acetyltransferase [Sphingomonas sp.]|uniref:GNAT family acetyltransferase n=1 Tax=Sphingomonas sp. TaxID=28214 RepID=UPI0039C98FC2